MGGGGGFFFLLPMYFHQVPNRFPYNIPNSTSILSHVVWTQFNFDVHNLEGENGSSKGASIGGPPNVPDKLVMVGPIYVVHSPPKKSILWGFTYCSFYYVINSPITKAFKHEILICFKSYITRHRTLNLLTPITLYLLPFLYRIEQVLQLWKH
jgi:hypothetical protein